MDVFEAIRKRRSIRSFTGEPVTDDELRQILEAGIDAPSAGNMQARELILVKTAEGRRKVCAATDAGNTTRGGIVTQEWVGTAAVIIIICYDEKRMAAKYGDKGRYSMTKLDCMGVAENMMLAITALGLGSTCVIGFHPDKLRANIPIPPELTPQLILPIGRPAEEPKEIYRMGIEDIVRLEC
jgi:nitroreductase